MREEFWVKLFGVIFLGAFTITFAVTCAAAIAALVLAFYNIGMPR